MFLLQFNYLFLNIILLKWMLNNNSSKSLSDTIKKISTIDSTFSNIMVKNYVRLWFGIKKLHVM